MEKNKKQTPLWATWPVAFLIVASVMFVGFMVYGILEDLSLTVYNFYAQYTPRAHWGVSMVFVPVYVAIYYWAKHKAKDLEIIPLHIAIVATVSFAMAVLFGYDALVKMGFFAKLFPLAAQIGGQNFILPPIKNFITGGVAMIVLLSIPTALLLRFLSRNRSVLGRILKRDE